MNELQIKKFSDHNLVLSLGDLFDCERKTDRLILLHLLEVSDRKVFAKRGFPSLFAMLVGFYKLSEGSANRRIQAMRLLKDVPIAQESLVAGEVNLTTLSMAQVQIRHEEKITGEKVSAEKKATIVESIKNKTQAQVAVELFRQLPETATAPRNEERRISETETRLSHNFPDRVLKKLKRLREIWSHVDPNMDYVEIIERCADETLKRIDPTFNDVDSNPKLPELSSDKKLPQRLARHRLNGVSQNERPTESPNNFKRPTYYRKGIKNGIYSKAGACCEFVDPKTGNRCSSKFLLQIDHKIPIWAGGTNEPGNLQLLCSTHNRLKYAIETKQTFLSDRGKAYRVSGNYVLTG